MRCMLVAHACSIWQKKELKLKLFSADVFRWGGGLARTLRVFSCVPFLFPMLVPLRQRVGSKTVKCQFLARVFLNGGQS